MEFPPRNKEVSGWKETNTREKSGKAIQSKPEGKPLWKWGKGDHLLASRKSPSNYDYL